MGGTNQVNKNLPSFHFLNGNSGQGRDPFGPFPLAVLGPNPPGRFEVGGEKRLAEKR